MNSLRSIVLCLGVGLVLSSVGLRGGILIDKLMWENPAEYAIDKGFAKQWWNVDLFCRSHSGSQAYIGHRESNGQIHLENTIITAIDPCFNRLLYMGQERNAIRSYGSCGTGANQFTVPLAIDITAPINAAHTYSTYYNIFVADRDNNRAERLRYDWTNPDAGITHIRDYTGADIVHPIDVDLDNSGTFYPDNDDFLWIACENNKIVAVNTTTGAIAATYGSTGSGTGQFSGISAIACGRSFDLDFANNNTFYVADRGNGRIVLLAWSGGAVSWGKTWYCPVGAVTDLDVDNFGQVWATLSDGSIRKFTSDLEELGLFDPDTPGHQLNHPTCISNTGGYLGGGDMLVAESWTDSSGLRAYAISTDITDLYANPYSHGSGRCSCMVYFTLADYSTITFGLYNESGTQIRSGGPGVAMSGTNSLFWDGKDANGNFVPAGNYRSQVTATSLYFNRITGQRVNTVTKSVWFSLCGSACTWRVGDANSDGSVDISDVVYLIAYIFSGGLAPKPHPVGSGDPDCSKHVDIGDVVYLLARIFSGGSPPGNPDGIPPDDCTCSDYQ